MSEKFFRKGPQNAAKNKPHIPTDAELASVPASDERKTVILDEDLEGVDLEDRVWLYWKRNRNDSCGIRDCNRSSRLEDV